MGKRHIPKNLRRKKKKNSAGAAALAVCLMLFVLLIGAVIGRYQRQLGADVPARAKEFYFTSNFLDGKTHTLAPGSTKMTFTLGNHADDLRFSEVDIDYVVTVTDDNGKDVTVADDNGNEVAVTVTNDKGKLATGSVQNAKVTISDLKAGKTYTVTAVGKGGYSKTLTAKIVVLSQDAQLYYYKDNVPGEYILLTVWNEGDAAGEVTIQYTGIPDNTNPDMTNWETGGDTPQEQVVAIAPHTSMVFRFFGETAGVTVTGVGTEVKIKNPG